MSNAPRLPRILLTNDDGIYAEGLAHLQEIAREFAEEVWVVAPKSEQSGKSMSFHEATVPLAYERQDEHKWSVDGTPCDCVAVGVNLLMKDQRPSLILSGINRGENYGESINFSGTVGAALMGLTLGIPSIALSLIHDENHAYSWEAAREVVPKMLRYFLADGWKKDTSLCINIPSVPPEKITGFAWARQGRKIDHIDVTPFENPYGKTFAWIKPQHIKPSSVEPPDTDCAIIARGKVAVSALSIDRSVEVLKPAVRFAEIE